MPKKHILVACEEEDILGPTHPGMEGFEGCTVPKNNEKTASDPRVMLPANGAEPPAANRCAVVRAARSRERLGPPGHSARTERGIGARRGGNRRMTERESLFLRFCPQLPTPTSPPPEPSPGLYPTFQEASTPSAGPRNVQQARRLGGTPPPETTPMENHTRRPEIRGTARGGPAEKR